MLETGLRSYSTSGCQSLNRAKVSYRAGVPECLWILLPSFPPLRTGLSAWWGKHNRGPEWGGGLWGASPHGAGAGRGVQGIAAGLVGSQHRSLGKIKKKTPAQKAVVVNAEMAGGFLGANLHIAGGIFPFESPSFLIFFSGVGFHGFHWAF